jgi:hypothetical protein
MNAWIAIAFGYPGFALLASAMERHCEDMLGREPARAPRRLAQALGALLLTASLAVCVAAWGGSAGAAIWLGVLTVCALALGAQLTYAPKPVPRLAAALALIGLLALLWSWLR